MKRPEKQNWVDEFSPKQLVINVYVSQGIFIIIAGCMALIFNVTFPWSFNAQISFIYLLAAIVTGLVLPVMSIQLKNRLPSHYFDDGGINEKIFGTLSYLHIFVLTGVIAFAEEWLFRGVLQPLIGLVATSLIFSLLHVRYMKKPVLFGIVTMLSFWLGFLYEWTNTIWIPFLAHFLIDFISGCYIARHYQNNVDSEKGSVNPDGK
ncbi:CPBP family intramembrane metalloprotease [Fictibacillus nanhaiensis]|uniref:CPBP family intramembrane glutamic endopeptidase n=1 Tax=Fictibacillus nanhaiensis TaxID=742169 RepID=UPI001C98083E|nr:CPBP family intramembrane glutamic endopeptidase [Fictibacillus nanhaiensis]MBY6035659.1 CPBP family intramembrane metalloprotease [Fictibacillus nanhaiensis]